LWFFGAGACAGRELALLLHCYYTVVTLLLNCCYAVGACAGGEFTDCPAHGKDPSPSPPGDDNDDGDNDDNDDDDDGGRDDGINDENDYASW
jgi:hypothetical protein